MSPRMNPQKFLLNNKAIERCEREIAAALAHPDQNHPDQMRRIGVLMWEMDWTSEKTRLEDADKTNGGD